VLNFRNAPWARVRFDQHFPVDGIPWEINLLQNSGAYKIARRAFLMNYLIPGAS
jgi:hypothetical protein